ncbi:AraC family transcriptional regulator [Yoonia sp. I 8.24]|uniref:AraC family transcriptional regulator n=1 Tax=Yoonia sp. I 8.24 TaxID=1537229 RepID=UPI001EDD728C|nr:AraC family transcriptional regulator [Yoonia sp. I 8.24]MCG3266512.1 AraC family transcriptional regulator [Yoonia sp. I 8.24]
MSKDHIKALIERHLPQAGLIETKIPGVELFHVDAPVPCVPAVYEPTIVAILSGAKEAVLGGERHVYNTSKYLLSPMTMPVEAGAPQASADTPLLGVKIALNSRVMTELTIELESAAGAIGRPEKSAPQGLALASWDRGFTQALLRLLELLDNPVEMAVLGPGRLRELYYAVLQGDAGFAARRAFGVGSEIARTIDYVATRLNAPVTIDEMAAQVGMSRAAFHRRFKQATTMSPIQFVKSMRLNNAAMKIAGGMSVSEAAWDVGYESASQFSREFKRMYGQSPRQWGIETRIPVGLM